MTTYTIRQRAKEFGSDTLYEVAKFTDHNEPDQIYTVTVSPSGDAQCDCPGHRWTPGPEHKHIRLVKAFIYDGNPPLAAYRFAEPNSTPQRVS